VEGFQDGWLLAFKAEKSPAYGHLASAVGLVKFGEAVEVRVP